MMRTIHCFFSGGRDSAVACYIAYQVAQRRRWAFRLVHIDTTVAIRQTREYVRQYAEWLGAELVVLRPEKTFREYAEKFGMWPSLYPQQFRWCYRRLKLQPIIKYIHQEYRKGDLVVMGVRRDESTFRGKFYTATFFERDYGGIKAQVWAPLLFVDGQTLTRLIERLGIPRNPVWRFGFSGECLCLAGMPLYKIALILRYFPEERNMLLEIDDVVNKNRRSGTPSAPFRLAQAGCKTLREFYQQAVKAQLTLDDFVMPYKSCEGSCML
jgi:3'-phosphoadenosine 5'-phosphosulfate sulfotransferase (PAPS reductase)/FAD synthetase